MAWRKPLERPRIEPPLWYRVYDPQAWDEPDGHELAMIAGSAGYKYWPHCPDSAWQDWPQFLHEQHARRCWGEAQHAYRQAHPLLATQEFNEIRARHAERRQAREFIAGP